ncbi:MAG: alpha/beta fold hydrolase [Planctomycetaceae bacterium]|nr:alpha/beta fold hydrolase [Planctomycetaceae bacterium]
MQIMAKAKLRAAGVLFLLNSVWGTSPAVAQQPNRLPTLELNQDVAMKTLGGMQFWGDVAYCHGWRIQHNTFFKQHRLLDPDNCRHCSGTLEDCQKALDEIKKEKNLPKMSGHAVVLIHGIIRSSKSFTKMAETLKKDGYTVIGFDYPSTQVEITQSAEYLHQLLESLEGVEKISFVVHSMGGLVVRSFLKEHQDDRIQRMVMLGVPNQGANIADMLKNNVFFKLIYGPAGKQLGIDEGFIANLPTPKFEFGVIAGARGDEKGYNPLVPGDDDGTVSVESARLPGAADYAAIQCLHSFIMNHAETIAYTSHFLKTGQFRKAGEKQPIPIPPKEAEQEKPNATPDA